LVHLDKIYTKSGDTGKTSLGNGERVQKTHPRVVAYGGVDELNSLLGLAEAGNVSPGFAEKLTQIQNDLFDMGADLCVPMTFSDESQNRKPVPRKALRMVSAQTERLERWIDEATEVLQPLTSFVLPGGSKIAAALHLARSVCRRVEISVLVLAEKEAINPHTITYLNRLSDLLFVLARLANNNGQNDILWEPGKGLSNE